jgi:hypothetical protein
MPSSLALVCDNSVNDDGCGRCPGGAEDLASRSAALAFVDCSGQRQRAPVRADLPSSVEAVAAADIRRSLTMTRGSFFFAALRGWSNRLGAPSEAPECPPPRHTGKGLLAAAQRHVIAAANSSGVTRRDKAAPPKTPVLNDGGLSGGALDGGHNCRLQGSARSAAGCLGPSQGPAREKFPYCI